MEGTGVHSEKMTPGEIERIVEIGHNMGVNSIKFTGGEPLMRNDIVDIVRRTRKHITGDISMTTNGFMLPVYAEKLREAGLDRINISFHSLERESFQFITGTDSMDKVIDAFIQSGYSKILVYEGNLDNIKGWLFNKDIFKQPDELKSILREVLFIPETKKSLEMLNEFLNKHFSVAVVVDEFGGTAGLITVEDLIEELFGEIRDEYDESEEKMIKKIEMNSFILNGKTEIDILNEEYELNIPDGDYETIAGYIMLKIGRIPHKGESFKVDNYLVHIIRSDKTKIDLIKFTVENTDKKSEE